MWLHLLFDIIFISIRFILLRFYFCFCYKIMIKLFFYLKIFFFITLNNVKSLESDNLSDEKNLNSSSLSYTSSYEYASDPNEPILWFPYPPHYRTDMSINKSAYNIEKNLECDNGMDNIQIDYDPNDQRQFINSLCLDNRTKYDPNINTSALLIKSPIPAAYEPPLKCLNETINYTQLLPTFGAYRPLPPRFGTYEFLAPQRWLHSLADGAIVFLYHPCAFPGQITQLQNILRGCLYRHIITPSLLMTPKYPLALLAWGKSLQISVVDERMVIEFIRENARKGFRQQMEKLEMPSKMYNVSLLNEAHLVTDDQDNIICPYKEMR